MSTKRSLVRCRDTVFVLILDVAFEVVVSADFPIADVAYNLPLAFLLVDCLLMATKILFEREDLPALSVCPVGHVAHAFEGLLRTVD